MKRIDKYHNFHYYCCTRLKTDLLTGPKNRRRGCAANQRTTNLNGGTTMTDRNDFESLLEVFGYMDTTALKYPTIPMGVYHQEAVDLLVWIQADREALEGAGLDWVLVEGLEQRIGASRHAQSTWTSLRFAKAEAQREYAERSPNAYDLRDTIIHHMLFAYRNEPDILGRVRSIADGSGDADMLQDLSDLGVLGRTYPEPLAAVNFDTDLLDQVDTTCESLAPLLAIATGEGSLDSETKLNRDRAYTYLKQAVDEIREFGRYVFWRNPARIRGYASEYSRRHRSPRKSGNGAEEIGMYEITETASEV